MDRRTFLKSATTAGLATSAFGVSPAFANSFTATERSTSHFSGSNLSGWETVVGDGILHRPGQAAVGPGDIITNHQRTHSTLVANTKGRGVMAHNITFKRIIDDGLFDVRHDCSYEFRIPTLPSRDAVQENAQTVEGGFFIWDGIERRDHGLGFQWLLNPWADGYGDLRIWSMSKVGWKKIANLEPDTSWHRVDTMLDPTNGKACVSLDGIDLDTKYTRRPKHDWWGTEKAARLQIEAISLDPGSNNSAPPHRIECRNWDWTCEPV